MRIIKLSAKGKLEVKSVKNELSVLQNEVGGYIEQITFADDAVLLVDEDARMKNRSRNPFLHTLCGDIVVCGIKNNEWCSLPLFKARKLAAALGKKME